MHLHLLLGPTGLGKTDRAIALAQQYRCPVLALTRFEVYYELATGCGRPAQEDLAGTQRLYPQDRPLQAGELTASEAHELVRDQVARVAREHDVLVLEGGSTSLCQQLHQTGWWPEHRMDLTYVQVTSAEAYAERLQQRIKSVLYPKAGRTSLLDELVYASRFPEQLPFVEGVLTYAPIAKWCRRRGLETARAHELLAEPAEVQRVADELVNLCLEYGRLQQTVFQQILKTFPADRSAGPTLPATWQ